MPTENALWDRIEKLRKGFVREMMAWRFKNPELRDNVKFKDPETEREYQKIYGGH